MEVLVGPSRKRGGIRVKEKCFQAWVEHLGQLGTEDAKMRRAVVLMSKAKLYMAWGHWADIVHEILGLRHKADKLVPATVVSPYLLLAAFPCVFSLPLLPFAPHCTG